MGIREDYEAKLDRIIAIKDDEIIHSLHLPLSAFLQEADNLYSWCREDRETLIKAGLDWDLAEDIPLRAGAVREAEARWTTVRNAKKESRAELKLIAGEIRELRQRLLHEFRFAFRNKPGIITGVRTIAKKNSLADMIQHLNDLSVLGKANAGELAGIQFDMTLLDTASELAVRGSDIYASVTAQNYEKRSTVKMIRDKAVTFLKAAVDEVRRYGQFVYWQDDARKQGYTSVYLRKYRKKQEKAGN